jgi:hypothetical protein
MEGTVTCQVEKRKCRLEVHKDRLKSMSVFVASDLSGVGFLSHHGVKHTHLPQQLGKLENSRGNRVAGPATTCEAEVLQ